MNIQPKLSTPNHCPTTASSAPFARRDGPALALADPATGPRSVLGLPDGRVLALGEGP